MANHLIEKNKQIRIEKNLPLQILKQVRIYTGIPSLIKDRANYERQRRQISAWKLLDPRIDVTARELRYPSGWPSNHNSDEKPREKGVDIVIAIDFVSMAFKQEFDTGILFSADTDFKPALEFVWSSSISARPEVVAWRGDAANGANKSGYNQRLSLDSNDKQPFCHFLRLSDYELVKDHTNYAIKLSGIFTHIQKEIPTI